MYVREHVHASRSEVANALARLGRLFYLVHVLAGPSGGTGELKLSGFISRRVRGRMRGRSCLQPLYPAICD